ncbi:MAG: hypothetical protein ABH891_06960 [Candidatus Omnitrophota bacterium]
MEKKIVPTLINFNKVEMGAILADPFGNKKKARITWILIGILFLGACPLFAAKIVEPKTVKKESTLNKIGSLEKRGAVNFLTSPAELVYAFKGEKKDHPKAWPLTYVPRLFTNMAIRVGSSVNDILVLPWYAAASDATPLTRRFELPDYVWEQE